MDILQVKQQKRKLNFVIPGQLPEKHHEDDTAWIAEQLSLIPSSMRARACERYSAVYAEAYAEHYPAVYATCKARFAANSRLREFVARVQAAMGGQVSAPPTVGHHQGNIAQSVPRAEIDLRTRAGRGNEGEALPLEMQNSEAQKGQRLVDTSKIDRKNTAGARVPCGFEQNQRNPHRLRTVTRTGYAE